MVKQQEESWINHKWRPMMGWVYMVVCIFDFIIFPALWSFHLGYLHQPVTQWQPLTLQSGGFFHLAMGAIVGITSWKRTEEKLANKI